MPRYTIRAPDGKTYSIAGPTGATDEQVRQQILAQHPEAAQGVDYWANRWRNLPPERARALVQRFSGHSDNGGAINASDPRIIALTRRANTQPARQNTPAPTTRDRAIAAGRATAEQDANTSGNYLSAIGGAIRRGVSDVSLGAPEKLAALGERYLPASVTGNTSNASYDDILAAVRARNDADMAHAPITATGARIATDIVSGAPIMRAGGNVLSRLAPRVAARVAAVLTPVAGRGVANVGRASLAGAAGGATSAVGNGESPVTGAITGAIAGPVFQAAGKVLRGGAQAAADALGVSSPASVLRRFTTGTSDTVEPALNRRAAAMGAQPTVFEALSPADQEAVRGAVRQMPAGSRARADAAIVGREAAAGPQMASRVDQVTQQSQGQRIARIATDLARSRQPHGATAAPQATAEDLALARRAANAPLDLETATSQQASNIMRPYDNQMVFPSVRALHPQVPNEDGTALVTNPEINSVINGAAGARALSGEVTGSDLTLILRNLSRISRNPDHVNFGTAQTALDHVHGLIEEHAPDVSTAIDRMNDAFSAGSRMAEGVDAGVAGRLREQVTASRVNRNAFDTPEGDIGRAMGARRDMMLSTRQTPQTSNNTIADMATNPTTQEAMAANLSPEEAAQITQSAQAQNEGLQALRPVSTSPAPEGEGLLSPRTVMHGLLAPTSAYHKMAVLSRFARLFTHLPEAQSNALVDGLFSQNPTQIAQGLRFLGTQGDRGREALNVLGATIGAGASTGALAAERLRPDPGTPAQSNAPDLVERPDDAPLGPDGNPLTESDERPDDTPITLDDGDNQGQPVENGAEAGQGEGQPVDPANSPYTARLSALYQSENPALLNLVDRQMGQESGGRQHDAQGRPVTSRKGAIGIMQVMPGTAPEAARLAGVPWDANAYRHDAAYNKLIGVAYLSQLLREHHGDVARALAAYNAGPGRVRGAIATGGDDWLSHLPAETQDYVAGDNVVVIQYLSLAMWSCMAIYLTAPLIRALKRRAKSLDPLWAAMWPLAVNRCAFITNSLFLHRDATALTICYALSVVAGLIFFAAVFSYRKHDA